MNTNTNYYLKQTLFAFKKTTEYHRIVFNFLKINTIINTTWEYLIENKLAYFIDRPFDIRSKTCKTPLLHEECTRPSVQTRFLWTLCAIHRGKRLSANRIMYTYALIIILFFDNRREESYKNVFYREYEFIRPHIVTSLPIVSDMCYRGLNTGLPIRIWLDRRAWLR